MTETNAGGFFYDLNIKSNLNKTKNEMKGFDRATSLTSRSLKTLGLVGASVGAVFTGVNKVAKGVNAINVASNASGESISTIKQFGTEFKLLGLEAEQGEDLVNSLAKKLIDFENLGEGNAGEFARLGINLSDIENAEQLIGELRKSAQNNPDLLRSLSSSVGLSDQQLSYVFEDSGVIAQNRAKSIELTEKYNSSLEASKDSLVDFNKSVGEASIKLSTLGLDIGSELFRGVSNIIDFYSEPSANLSRVKEDVVKSSFFNNEYTGAFAEGASRDINFIKGLFTGESFGGQAFRWNSGELDGNTSSKNITDNRTYNVNVANPQEANELQIFNESQGGF